MKQTLITLFISLCCMAASAQSFEGEITYTNTIKSKVAQVSDEQFTSMLGDTQHYYTKAGNYKAETNGKFVFWQLYINADNKLYNKLANSEAILWNDGAVNQDSVLSFEITKNAAEVLGYKCDQLILHCKSGTQTFYYSSKIPVDSKLFSKHLYDNWYFYLTKAHAMPLKMIIENAQFSLQSVATEVKPMKLDASMFVLPPGVTLAKSPY
jgi:hypothetical protein